MKKIHFSNLLLLLCVAAVLLACERDQNLPSHIKAPTEAGFKALRAKALENITQKKIFNGETGFEFTSKQGAELFIFPNCLMDETNTIVTGEVEMTFIEIYDRGNMVLTNKPVMAKDPETGHSVPLITGGQYLLEVKQGDKKLRGCHYRLNVPGDLTGGVDTDMVLWDGTIDNDGNLIYENVTDRQSYIEFGETLTEYGVIHDRFHWCNIDKYLNYDGPKTRIKVHVPSAYNSKNSAVYVAFSEENKALAQLDTYNETEKYFSEHYGFVPVDKTAHIIFISESQGSAVYVIKSVTIAANQSITIATNELQTGTLEQVIALINALN